MSEVDVIQDGDLPAFPRNYSHMGHNGMSLRDWFAGQALTGLMANPEMTPVFDENKVARELYKLADAMLDARTANGGRP